MYVAIRSFAGSTAFGSITRALAVEWASRGIRVNAIGPGYHWTPLMEEYVNRGALDKERIRKRIPAGRIGGMEDIGRVLRLSNRQYVDRLEGGALGHLVPQERGVEGRGRGVGGVGVDVVEPEQEGPIRTRRLGCG